MPGRRSVNPLAQPEQLTACLVRWPRHPYTVRKIKLDPPSDMILACIAQKYWPDPRSPRVEQLTLATRDGLERLLAPTLKSGQPFAEQQDFSALSWRLSGRVSPSPPAQGIIPHQKW
jgi:hypothetical protein